MAANNARERQGTLVTATADAQESSAQHGRTRARPAGDMMTTKFLIPKLQQVMQFQALPAMKE